MDDLGWLAYFSGKNLESQKILSTAYAINPDDQWIGFGMADTMFASIDQAIKSGMSEKEALEKILTIRPNHIAALKRKLMLAKHKGNAKEIEQLKSAIFQISPLDNSSK